MVLSYEHTDNSVSSDLVTSSTQLASTAGTAFNTGRTRTEAGLYEIVGDADADGDVGAGSGVEDVEQPVTISTPAAATAGNNSNLALVEGLRIEIPFR